MSGSFKKKSSCIYKQNIYLLYSLFRRQWRCVRSSSSSSSSSYHECQKFIGTRSYSICKTVKHFVRPTRRQREYPGNGPAGIRPSSPLIVRITFGSGTTRRRYGCGRPRDGRLANAIRLQRLFDYQISV